MFINEFIIRMLNPLVQYVAQYPDTWNKNSIFEAPFSVLGKRSISNESWTCLLYTSDAADE